MSYSPKPVVSAYQNLMFLFKWDRQSHISVLGSYTSALTIFVVKGKGE